MTDRTIYYLESIARSLDSLAKIQCELSPHGLAHEALSDNRDWLCCYIDKLRKERESA